MHRVRKFAPRVRKPDEPDKSNGVESLNKNKVCAGLEAHANDTLSPPLVNNTNSENGFVLFFAADFFGIIVERNYKSQPEQRADWANLRTIQVIILLFFKWIF